MNEKMKKILAWLFWISSILGYLLMFYNHRIAGYFLTLGASSLWISFGVFTSDDYSATLSMIAAIWCLLFLVLALMSIYKSIKNQYRLFSFLITADAIITIAFVVYSAITKNWYSFDVFVWDAVISAVYVLLFYKSVKTRKCSLLDRRTTLHSQYIENARI